MNVMPRFSRSLLALSGCLVLAQTAQAASVTVTTEAELIAAITAANASGQPTTIRLTPKQYNFTQAFESAYGPSALPPITGSITIKGQNADNTVLFNQEQLMRFFTVLDGARLVLKNVKLTEGLIECSSNYDCERSGGGAVANIGGALWIEHCVLSNNNTYYQEGLGEVRGGAISSADGYLRIEHSTLVDNGTLGDGGGISVLNGSSEINQSSLLSNGVSPSFFGATRRGSGLLAQNADVTIKNSTIAENTGASYEETISLGIGLYNWGGTMRVINSTITGNSMPFGGGGAGIANTGNLLVRNSEISGNTAANRGGGLYNTGQVRLDNVLIKNNELTGFSDSGFPGVNTPQFPPGCDRIEHPENCTNGGGGLYNEPSGTVTLKHTAITRNHFTNGTPSDCDGTVISEGHNRFGVGSSGCTVINPKPSDQFEGP